MCNGKYLSPLFSLFADVLAYYIPHSPCCLQIETSGDGIDIDHLAGEEESGAVLALQRVHVYRRERDTATCHELVAETALARDAVYVVGECFHDAVEVLLAQFAPLADRKSVV